MFKMVEISLMSRFQMIWITGRYLFMWVLMTCSISILKKKKSPPDHHLRRTRTGANTSFLAGPRPLSLIRIHFCGFS